MLGVLAFFLIGCPHPIDTTLAVQVTDADSDGTGAQVSAVVTSSVVITPINDLPVTVNNAGSCAGGGGGTSCTYAISPTTSSHAATGT